MKLHAIELAGRRILNVGSYTREHSNGEVERRIVLALSWLDSDPWNDPRDSVVTFPAEHVDAVVKALRRLVEAT